MIEIREQLRRDLEERVTGGPILPWIEQKAAHLATLGLHRSGKVELTSALMKAAKISRIKWFQGSTDIRGKIKSTQGGYEIWVSSILDPAGKRITIAHEIGHTLWFAPGKGTQPISRYQRSLLDHDIELLCDFFAETLLIPEPILRKELAQPSCAEEAALTTINHGPDLATRLLVPERYVIDRLSLWLSNSVYGYVCASKVKDACSPRLIDYNAAAKEQWQLRWAYSPRVRRSSDVPAGFGVPGIGGKNKPIIPVDMIPPWISGQGLTGRLDARWSYLINPTPSNFLKRGLRAVKTIRSTSGVARRVGDRIYVGIPLDGDHTLLS